MSLRDRCKDWCSMRARNEMLRQSSEVDDLEAFVLSERGRATDDRLSGAAPLVLYFSSNDGREEVIAAVLEAKPGMLMKKMP